MADPNFAAVAEMIAYMADDLDEFEKKSVTASTGLIATQEAARNDIEGVWAQSAREALLSARDGASLYVSGESVRARVDPLLRQMMVAIGKPVRTPDLNWEQLYDYCIANSQSVNSRALTFGTPSAGGGNVGTGTVIRVTLDEEGHSLEGWWPDAFRLVCDQDVNQLGFPHEERWHLEGSDAARDNLERQGTGLIQGPLVTLNDRASAPYVLNASFDDGTFSGASITALTSWTVTGSLSNLETNTTSTYIWADTTKGGTARSLRFIANETISQVVANVARPQFSRDFPYVACVAVYRRDSCDGTLTLTVGAVSRAVTVSGLSDNAFTLVHLVATPGTNNWYENLKANSFTVSLALSSRTTGSLYVDGLIISPMTRIGQHRLDTRRGRGASGTYISVIAGRTPFLMGDVFTWTDSESTRGVNQFWLGQIGGYGYLPSNNSAAETIADK